MTLPLPNAIIGGAQKSGTTTLHRLLETHPQTFTPSRTQEIHYFDLEENYSRGLDWYASFFSGWRGEPVVFQTSPLYLYQLVSHRLLRYASPFLHLIALAANLALLGQGRIYAATLAGQAALLLAALLARVIPTLPFRVARYYVLVTASIAAGLWDRMRQGPPAAWEKAEGTR